MTNEVKSARQPVDAVIKMGTEIVSVNWTGVKHIWIYGLCKMSTFSLR